MAELKCSACGTTVPGGALSCPQCSTPTEASDAIDESVPVHQARPTHEPESTSRWSIASFVSGAVWLLGIGSVLAILFGRKARSEIRASEGRLGGRGLATAGVTLGYMGLLVLVVAFIAVTFGDDLADDELPFGARDAMSLEEFCDITEGIGPFDGGNLEGAATRANVDALRRAADSAPSIDMRDAADSLAENLGAFATVLSDDDPRTGDSTGPLADLDVAGLETAHERIATECSQLEDAPQAALSGQELTSEQISGRIDNALEQYGLGEMGIDEASEILAGLARTGLLDEIDIDRFVEEAPELFEGLDLDSIGDESASGHDEAYRQCGSDVQKQAQGDNEGCDELYEACSAGDMAACDDLWLSANVGSEYETFGGTCGGRSRDPLVVGRCQSTQ